MNIRNNRTSRGKHLCSFLVIVIFFFPIHGNTSAETGKEYNVKALFTLNIARYAKWPDEALADGSSPYRLCVVGDMSIEPAFQTVIGKKIGSRELLVSFLNTPQNIEGCHMVFISRTADASEVRQVLDSVKGKPVLTLGETRNFIRQGGMINFFFKNGRLNFEINMDIVRRQKVKLSSRLLKLAILIGEK